MILIANVYEKRIKYEKKMSIQLKESTPKTVCGGVDFVWTYILCSVMLLGLYEYFPW